MKTNTYKLVLLLVPVLAISFLATGCVNEFMLAANSGMYDPYYGQYYDDGEIYIENHYYPAPVTRTTTIIESAPAPTTVIYENDRPGLHREARPRRQVKHRSDNDNNQRPSFSKANNDDNRRPSFSKANNDNNRRPSFSKANNDNNRRPSFSKAKANRPVQQTKSLNSGDQRQRPSSGLNSRPQRQRPSSGANSSSSQSPRTRKAVNTQKKTKSSSSDEEIIWPKRSRGKQN
ncbi:MAG: hypothetical protein LBE80_06955 [Deltaproteobacteria bacterium]|nr:hypothetical protein [Deltaproteobacteria bacterium]